ncbi:MAG: alkaline phosphatase family protein, partial [Gemmatimonadota bacterium]|nr:alkaline phosphatase family protein [Gemmatimonadota bacterium]
SHGVSERVFIRTPGGWRIAVTTAFGLPAGSAPQCRSAPANPTTSAPTAPRLLVFITIDALRPDYFTRYDRQLAGGLARLYRNGAVFTNGYQDHAITETAPGHSATLSGRFPVHTGISTNATGVEDSSSPLLEAEGLGASPFRFKGSTLIDWLIAKDSRTRVLSVSRKDRGAILPIGRSRQPVFWYAANGTFTTSTYYSAALPVWVREFNARKLAAGYAGRVWSLLLPSSEYAEPDSVPIESQGVGFTFPHRVPDDAASAARVLPDLPWMDDVTLALAMQGLETLGLGTGPQTDVLAISLSATDAIGHRYGPDSREIHDQILRLDRTLGVFLDSLFKVRSANDIVIALTADHGITPFPGVRSQDPSGGAKSVDPQPLLREMSNSLAAAGVPGAGFRYLRYVYLGNGFEFASGVLRLDQPALRAAGINADSVVERFRAGFLALPGIARADRIRELAQRDTLTDHIARRWLHAFASDEHASLVVTPAPYSSWAAAYAMHGTPNEIDARVPIIFYGRAFNPGRYPQFARVVDMAPTLATVLRVVPSERLDGRVLSNAIR